MTALVPNLAFAFTPSRLGVSVRDHVVAREAPCSEDAASVRDDEATLIALALRGRREAWNTLIERHNHRVVVALLARGVPLERARDLAQDAWLKLVEQQTRGNLRELVLPGLAVTQALFLARDDARRQRRPGAVAPAAGHPDDDEVVARAAAVVDPSASVEERLLRGEQLARAARALSECHPTAQRVFRMIYENPDAPHADVAARVGLSLQRVRQIVCEVRKKLREAIEVDVHE